MPSSSPSEGPIMYRNLPRTLHASPFILAAVTSLLTASSCGNNIGQAKQGSVTGVVFKGLVTAAEVKAFAIDGARRSDELGTATTAEDGTFTVDVKSHAGPIMVCATRGTYVEEATGGLVQLGVNELCSLIEDHGAGDTSTTLLTPLTTFHTSLTGCFFDAGRDATLSAASQHSALRLNDFFAAGQAGFDVRTTIPLDPTTGLAASLTAEAWAGILVAGLSESAKGYAVASGLDPGVRVTAATLTAALSQDIDDGACIFDGQTATARLVQGTVDLNEGALRGSPQGLATSILRFLESERNTSGIAQENVRDLVQRMQSHASEIFGGGGGGGADIDDPEVAFLAPTGAEPISVSGNIRIEVTAEDASSIDEFVFEAPARITGATKDCFPPDEVNATFRCSLVGELNTTLEPEGELLVTARARDASGNQTTTNLRLAINSARPVITFASPTVGAEVQETFEVRVTAADVDGIRSVTVTGATLNNTSPRTDEFTAAWDTTGEPEGPLTLTATATDERGLTAELSIDVVVDNLEDGRLTGAVDIGAPVAGSTVQAFALTANGRGAAVSAESITEEAGTYELLVPSYRGPILVVAREGVFDDVATGQPQTFGGTHELTAALPDFGPGLTATLNLNALTTLAAAHAVASAFSEAELAAAIETSTTRLGLHARRNGPERDALPVDTDVSASFSEPLISTADTTVMALFHAGLSRLALDATDDLILAPGDIGSLDLIEALVDDLDNVRFDGRNLAGQETFYDPSRTRSTSAYTVRFDLVSALHNFILNAPLERSRVVFPQNASGITTVQLSVPGGFYDDLAKNDDPRLFSAENPVIPFDVEPPVSGSLNPERIDGHGREIALAVDPPYQRARLKGRRARRQPDPSSRQAVAAT